MSPRSVTLASPETSELKKFGVTRKRFQHLISPLTPVLAIDAKGIIQDISLPALRLLGYHAHNPIDSCFLSIVHRKNLPFVLRDIEAMAQRGKTRATWLLRLRCGNQRWQWFRAVARIARHPDGRAIVITLRDLYER